MSRLQLHCGANSAGSYLSLLLMGAGAPPPGEGCMHECICVGGWQGV
eukprot:COSAG02_NODE_290_length_25531_cov_75.132392_14_plen_47_part_00